MCDRSKVIIISGFFSSNSCDPLDACGGASCDGYIHTLFKYLIVLKNISLLHFSIYTSGGVTFENFGYHRFKAPARDKNAIPFTARVNILNCLNFYNRKTNQSRDHNKNIIINNRAARVSLDIRAFTRCESGRERGN